MRKIKGFIIPVLVLAEILGFIAFILSRNNKAAAEEIKAEQQAIKFNVNAAYARLAETGSRIPIHGQVESRNVFTLYSEADGTVTHSAIEVGKFVTKGQILLSIDAATRIADQKILEQSLRKAQLEFEDALKNYNRFLHLWQNGNSSQIEYENAKAQLDAADVQWRTAQQQLKSGNVQVKQTELRAPASGIIVEKKVNPGDYLQPGTPIGTLAEQELMVTCFVPEITALQIKPRQPVILKTDALPNQKFSGLIKTIVPYSNEAKLYPIKIELKHSGTLLAGMSVQVIFSPGNNQKVIVIPRSALTGDFKKPTVFVLNNKKQPVGKKIKVGQTRGEQVEVLSGLQENELVITSGQSNIGPGKVLSDFKIIQ